LNFIPPFSLCVFHCRTREAGGLPLFLLSFWRWVKRYAPLLFLPRIWRVDETSPPFPFIIRAVDPPFFFFRFLSRIREKQPLFSFVRTIQRRFHTPPFIDFDERRWIVLPPPPPSQALSRCCRRLEFSPCPAGGPRKGPLPLCCRVSFPRSFPFFAEE